MSIAEKSMERTKFYNREDLKAKDVVRLIGIWEGGESLPIIVISHEKLIRTF